MKGWIGSGFVVAVGLLVAGQARGEEPNVLTLNDWRYYNTVGWVALSRGRLDRAENAFRGAIETLKPYEKTESRLLARSYADYAEVMVRQGKPNAAEPLAKWALAVREGFPGERAEALRQSLSLMARIQHDRGRPAEAEPHLRRLLTLQATHLRPGDPEVIATTEVLADVLSEQGKTAEAEAVFRRALVLREENSAQNLKVAERLEEEARILRVTSRGSATSYQAMQAERLETGARTARQSTHETVEAATTTSKFAKMLRSSGRQDEAETLEDRARALRDAAETRAAREK
jgi:tetratricopeptide (TPR) repeat protein